jgi:hypothetical protein
MRLIRNALAFLPALLLMANTTALLTGNKVMAVKVNIELPAINAIKTADCYAEWNLTAAGLSANAFTAAVKGYTYLVQKNYYTILVYLLLRITANHPGKKDCLYLI